MVALGSKIDVFFTENRFQQSDGSGRNYDCLSLNVNVLSCLLSFPVNPRMNSLKLNENYRIEDSTRSVYLCVRSGWMRHLQGVSREFLSYQCIRKGVLQLIITF